MLFKRMMFIKLYKLFWVALINEYVYSSKFKTLRFVIDAVWEFQTPQPKLMVNLILNYLPYLCGL